MAAINNIIKMGYVFKKSDLARFGNLSHIKDEYEVYVRVTVKAKLFGIQVDKKAKTFKVPIRLRSFKVHRHNNVVKNVTETVVTEAPNSGSFYDETFDEKLGGNKELLGG